MSQIPQISNKNLKGALEMRDSDIPSTASLANAKDKTGKNGPEMMS